MESRAAVFTSQPQNVEVYAAGEWLPGSLLGWRHDAGGACQVWVRLTMGGVEESTWTDLESLRLPEPHLAVAPEPAEAPAEDPAATRSLRLSGVSATGPVRRGRPAAPGARPAREVRELPAVREDAASRAVHPAGRRRADSRVVGETAEFPAVGVRAGRHRAPASPSGSGRHRAADTGVWPAVTDSPVDVRTPAARAAGAWGARSDDTWPGVSGASWSEPGAPSLEPDLLTRPMRLGGVGRGESVPQPRSARWDDTLTGV